MKRGNVDLRECKKGDELVTAHGIVMLYVEATPSYYYYDHFVKYKDDPYSSGSRTHDGHVFRESRRFDDEDIVFHSKSKGDTELYLESIKYNI